MGIDPSLTGTGVVVSDPSGELLLVRCYASTPSLSDMGRVRQLNELIWTDLDPFMSDDCLVCFEGYSMGSPNQGKIYARAELAGVLKYTCVEYYERPYIMVPPTSIKAFIGMERFKENRVHKKDAKKETARLVADIYDFRHDDDNIVDGFILARYAQACCSDDAPNHRNVLELPRKR